MLWSERSMVPIFYFQGVLNVEITNGKINGSRFVERQFDE